MTQLENAFRLLKINASNAEIICAQKEAMIALASINNDRPPYYGRALYHVIGKNLRLKDPYAQLKEKYNQMALDLYSQIENVVQNASDPLLTVMSLAIIGNTIDFATNHGIDVIGELNNFSVSKLIINHYAEFLKDIIKANKILILGDNAGEIVFDKLMIQVFKHQFPTKEFVYAVRGGPIINDATIQDAHFVKIHEVCQVIEGIDAPGVILEESSLLYQERFHSADLIISKGQGNFESVEDISTPNVPIYFLLKAKCDLIANTFNVPKGSLLFYRRDGSINKLVK